MRPAHRAEPAPPEDSPLPEQSQPSRGASPDAARSRRRLWAGSLVGVFLLAGGGLGGRALVTNRHPGPEKQGKPATEVPSRPPFVFRIGDVTADSTGRGAIGAARDASVEIAGHLSSFYDAVFMNPDTWKNGVPDGAWQLFDPSVRARARQDSSSLTLGPAAANLESIRVKTTSLSIEVLADPRGKPQTAIANVEFEADGTLAGGQPVTATNKASFLFQISNGEWLVFGYPAASTTIEAGVPSPSAGRASAGTSPSATGTTP